MDSTPGGDVYVGCLVGDWPDLAQQQFHGGIMAIRRIGIVFRATERNLIVHLGVVMGSNDASQRTGACMRQIAVQTGMVSDLRSIFAASRC